jgi:hypothetical protein
VPEDGGQKSFWATVPGVLSAGAGFLGAIAAVVGALASIGVFDNSDEPMRAASEEVPAPAQVRLRWHAEVVPGSTRFTIVEIYRVPAGTRITVKCDGRGCFDGTREQRVPDATAAVSLQRSIPELRSGSRLEITFVHPRVGTKIWTLTAMRRELPEMETSCVGLDET